MNPTYWSIQSVKMKLLYGETHMKSYEPDLYRSFLKPKGKMILDLGACDGDSAKVFLNAGAVRVLCVESNPLRASRIKLPNTITFAERFDPEKHLIGLNWDAAKVDIEGYEMLMLPYLDQISKPILVEVHNWYVREQFEKKGFYELSEPDPMLGLCLMGRE